MMERIIQFGDGERLSGVLRMDPSQHNGPALLLFNAGVVHRIGAHRINVKLARALNAPSLRFDLAGQGDSAPTQSGLGFERQAVADVGAAIDAISGETAADKLIAIGMCSGADHSLRAAIADERIRGLVLLDPFAYPNDSAAAADRLARAADPDRWSRKIRSLMTRKTQSPSAEVEMDAGADDIDQGRPVAPKAEFAADLATLVRRDVRLLIVYTGLVRRHVSQPAHFFNTFADYDFDNKIEVEAMPHADHTFTSLAAQGALTARVGEWLGRAFRAGVDGEGR